MSSKSMKHSKSVDNISIRRKPSTTSFGNSKTSKEAFSVATGGKLYIPSFVPLGKTVTPSHYIIPVPPRFVSEYEAAYDSPRQRRKIEKVSHAMADAFIEKKRENGKSNGVDSATSTKQIDGKIQVNRKNSASTKGTLVRESVGHASSTRPVIAEEVQADTTETDHNKPKRKPSVKECRDGMKGQKHPTERQYTARYLWTRLVGIAERLVERGRRTYLLRALIRDCLTLGVDEMNRLDAALEYSSNAIRDELRQDRYLARGGCNALPEDIARLYRAFVDTAKEIRGRA